MTPNKLKLIFVTLILGVLLFFGFQTWGFYYNSPKDSPTGTYNFTVQKGQTLRDLGQNLADAKVISSSSVLDFHTKFNPINNLQSGEFQLQVPNKPDQIITQIITQNQEIINKVAKENQRVAINLTFKEGIRLDQIINFLDENGVAKRKELEDYLRKPENFDRVRFPFLPEPLNCTYGDIKSCAKYYPEGYFYPDTYSFFKPSSPSEIFNKMLVNFDRKVWKVVQNDLGTKNFEKIIIMASTIEKESGRPINGVNSTNLDEVNGERSLIASTFYNRMQEGMKWQSDPTGSYWSGKTFCQQTLKSLDNCIYLNSPEAQNQYNTYSVNNYPIGPITSPQLDNILAAMKPQNSDYLFFVSDAEGKKYFAKTNLEHEENIAKAQQKNAKK